MYVYIYIYPIPSFHPGDAGDTLTRMNKRIYE